MGVFVFLNLLTGIRNDLCAQTAPEGKTSGRWYIGVDGGVPFGYASFQSIGSEHIHPGLSLGVLGGYRISPLLSAEASARIGWMTMTATECCLASRLRLGEWEYANLKSEVRLQEYVAQLNVNLKELFDLRMDIPWTFELSPRMGIALTQTDIRTYDDNVLRIKGAHRWHIEMGGQLQMTRTLSPHLALGIYTGLSFLTGRYIDNIHSGYHASNYVWHNGIRLIYAFEGRKEVRP